MYVHTEYGVYTTTLPQPCPAHHPGSPSPFRLSSLLSLAEQFLLCQLQIRPPNPHTLSKVGESLQFIGLLRCLSVGLVTARIDGSLSQVDEPGFSLVGRVMREFGLVNGRWFGVEVPGLDGGMNEQRVAASPGWELNT